MAERQEGVNGRDNLWGVLEKEEGFGLNMEEERGGGSRDRDSDGGGGGVVVAIPHLLPPLPVSLTLCNCRNMLR